MSSKIQSVRPTPSSFQNTGIVPPWMVAQRSGNTGIVPPSVNPSAPAFNTGIVPPALLEKIGHAGDQFHGPAQAPTNTGIVPPWLVARRSGNTGIVPPSVNVNAPARNTGIVPPAILQKIGQGSADAVLWN